jgi:hypothetical protein
VDPAQASHNPCDFFRSFTPPKQRLLRGMPLSRRIHIGDDSKLALRSCKGLNPRHDGSYCGGFEADAVVNDSEVHEPIEP